jgi:hypothetical protein
VSTRLTVDDARESLNAHVAEKGAAIRGKYGPTIGWAELQRLLADRAFVRYPCELAFDSEALEPGECAHPVAIGDRPEDGYRMCVHPFFSNRLEDAPVMVLYQLVLVNYGEFASADDAETFGASALGLTKDAYYERLCALADEVAGHGSCGCASGEQG